MIFVCDFDYIDPNYLGVQTLHVTSGRHYINGTDMYIPAILPGFTFDTQLYSQGTTKGEVTIGTGQLTIANTDGQFDFLRKCGLDGQRIKIWAPLNESDPLTNDNLYFVGKIFYPNLNFDKIVLYMKDQTEVLNVPAQNSLFAGTNAGNAGLEGLPTDLGGKPKPMVYGRVFNIPLYQINSSLLMYGCNYDTLGNAKAIYRVWNLYDKGGKLQFQADFSTSALLQAAVVQPGFYATCLANAQIKLGSVPIGAVTADIDENTLALSSAPYLVKRFFTDQGYVDGTDYHGGLLDQLHLLNNCPAGIFITDSGDTQLSVATDLLNSIGAWIAPDRLGIFQFGRFDLAVNTPQVSAMIVTRNTYKTGTLDRPMTGDQNYGIPAKQVNVHHSKRWIVQQEADLLPSLEPSLISFLGEPDTVAKATSPSVIALHALAPVIDYDTLLAGPMSSIVINHDFDYPILPNSTYSPVGSVNGGINSGWKFSSGGGGDGRFVQTPFGVQIISTATGDATLTQVLAIPSQLNVLNTYTLDVLCQLGSTNTKVIISQGSNLINSTISTFGSGTQASNRYTFTTLNSATSVTIQIQCPLGGAGVSCYIASVTLTNMSPETILNGSELNADITNAASIWSKTVGAGATVTQAAGKVTLNPSTTGAAALTCSLTLPDRMQPGQYTLTVYINAGTSGTITVVQNAITLATTNITAAQPYALNFNVTSTANPVILTITAPLAAVPIVVSISSAVLKGFRSAGLQNGTFALPIQNANAGSGNGGSLFNSPSLNGGWYFAALGNTSYTQANSQLSLTGTGGVNNPAVLQSFTVPDQLQIGTFTITVVVVSLSGAPSIAIQQGATTLLSAALVVGTNIASFTVPVSGTAVVVTIFCDVSSSLVLDSAFISETTGTLSPQDEANRLMVLEGSDLERYTFDMRLEAGMLFKPGDKFTLTETRFGLDNGKDFTLIGVKHDQGSDTVSFDGAG